LALAAGNAGNWPAWHAELQALCGRLEAGSKIGGTKPTWDELAAMLRRVNEASAAAVKAARGAAVGLTTSAMPTIELDGKPIKDPMPAWTKRHPEMLAGKDPRIMAAVGDGTIKTYADYRKLKIALGGAA
jgi:hypothetical protein